MSFGTGTLRTLVVPLWNKYSVTSRFEYLCRFSKNAHEKRVKVVGEPFEYIAVAAVRGDMCADRQEPAKLAKKAIIKFLDT